MGGGIGPVSGLTLAGILYATEFAVSYSRIPVNAGFYGLGRLSLWGNSSPSSSLFLRCLGRPLN